MNQRELFPWYYQVSDNCYLVNAESSFLDLVSYSLYITKMTTPPLF